jgi:hypothetical protein
VAIRETAENRQVTEDQHVTRDETLQFVAGSYVARRSTWVKRVRLSGGVIEVPAISVNSLFGHHLRLLGPNPANWTSKPIG